MSQFRSSIVVVLCALYAFAPMGVRAQAPSEDAPATTPAPAAPPVLPSDTPPPPADADDGTAPTDPVEPTRRPDGTVDTADVTQSGIMSDEQVLTEQAYGVETVRRASDPYEDPNKRYFFIGGFYRHHYMPDSIIELFVQDSPSVSNPQAGLELTIRRDSFEVVASAWYADFTAVGPFLANGDPATDIEIIDSNLRAVMVGATFLWSTMFNDYIGLEYGIGIGVGYVFGDMLRTEAYPSQNDGFAACEAPTAAGAPGSPQPGDGIDLSRSNGGSIEDYCGPALDDTTAPFTNQDGEEGEHYGIVARQWFDGGSVPNFWFRLAPQVSLRIKPIHHLVVRVDVGFDIFSGAYVGGGIGIGIN